jgi:hypothetical protein
MVNPQLAGYGPLAPSEIGPNLVVMADPWFVRLKRSGNYTPGIEYSNGNFKIRRSWKQLELEPPMVGCSCCLKDVTFAQILLLFPQISHRLGECFFDLDSGRYLPRSEHRRSCIDEAFPLVTLEVAA